MEMRQDGDDTGWRLDRIEMRQDGDETGWR